MIRWIWLGLAAGCGGPDAPEAIDSATEPPVETEPPAETEPSSPTETDTAVDPVGTTTPTAQGTYLVTWRHEPDPPTGGEATLHLVIRDAQDLPAVGATLDVTPWMPTMGHGVMGGVDVVELGDGGYRASWSYSMGGPWEVTLDIDAAAGPDSLVLTFDVTTR